MMFLNFVGMILPWVAIIVISYWHYTSEKSSGERFTEIIEALNGDAREERSELLNRIMAKNLTDFAGAQVIMHPPPAKEEPEEDAFGLNQI